MDNYFLFKIEQDQLNIVLNSINSIVILLSFLSGLLIGYIFVKGVTAIWK